MKLRPHLMAVVNLTPDSFSGDGRLADAPLDHVRHQVEAGADVVDLGAESTRPGARPLSADQEWLRLAPVLEGVVRQSWRARVALSVDTRHAVNASRALDLGVDIINDVGGLSDPAMRRVLAGARADVVAMHSLTVPADPARVLPPDCDVVQCLLDWRDGMRARAADDGIDPARIVWDPGLGFGKTSLQSLDIVLQAQHLVAGGGRWLFGHSRKSFLSLFTDASAADRDDLTLAFSASLAQAGVWCLRVHDVRRHGVLFDRLGWKTGPTRSG